MVTLKYIIVAVLSDGDLFQCSHTTIADILPLHRQIYAYIMYLTCNVYKGCGIDGVKYFYPALQVGCFFLKISFSKPNICIINMRCTKKYNIHFWMDDHKCIMLSSSNCGCYCSSISPFLKREHLRLMVYDLYVHKSGTIKTLKAVIYNVIFFKKHYKGFIHHVWFGKH